MTNPIPNPAANPLGFRNSTYVAKSNLVYGRMHVAAGSTWELLSPMPYTRSNHGVISDYWKLGERKGSRWGTRVIYVKPDNLAAHFTQIQVSQNPGFLPKTLFDRYIVSVVGEDYKVDRIQTLGGAKRQAAKVAKLRPCSAIEILSESTGKVIERYKPGNGKALIVDVDNTREYQKDVKAATQYRLDIDGSEYATYDTLKEAQGIAKVEAKGKRFKIVPVMSNPDESRALVPFTEAEAREISNLWHISRTALAGTRPTHYDRMIWTAKEWEKEHPGQHMRAYKHIDRNMTRSQWNPEDRNPRGVNMDYARSQRAFEDRRKFGTAGDASQDLDASGFHVISVAGAANALGTAHTRGSLGARIGHAYTALFNARREQRKNAGSEIARIVDSNNKLVAYQVYRPHAGNPARDRWAVMGNYGTGWEVLTFDESRKEAQQMLNDYRANERRGSRKVKAIFKLEKMEAVQQGAEHNPRGNKNFSAWDAKTLLESFDIERPYPDFHTVRSEVIKELLDAPELKFYRKPASASGSRGRYLYEYLVKLAKQVHEPLRNPVVSGTGEVLDSHDDHDTAPYVNVLDKYGYKYSHSVPVVYAGNNRIIHHVWKTYRTRPSVPLYPHDYNVSAWIKNGTWHWEAGKGGSSHGGKTGTSVESLDRYLKGLMGRIGKQVHEGPRNNPDNTGYEIRIRQVGENYNVYVGGTRVKTTTSKAAADRYKKYLMDQRRAFNKRNPEDEDAPLSSSESEAAEVFEMFHGEPSDGTLSYEETVFEPDYYTGLGDLVSLKVVTPKNKEVEISAPDPNRFDAHQVVKLACAADRKQLYFIGGDQALDTAKLGFTDRQTKHHMLIGVLVEVTYQTRKKFHKFKLTDYYHGLGEKSGNQPILIYDPFSQKLGVAGGNYLVEDVGITD